MAAPLVLSGARTLLSINNDIVAAGHVLEYTIDTSHIEINGIDNVLPFELAPDKVRVSASIRVYRTPNNSAVNLGYAPAAISAPDNQRPFTANSYITIEFRDKVTDATVMYLPRAMIVSRSGSVDSEGLLVETWRIMSIGATETNSPPSLFGSLKGIFG